MVVSSVGPDGWKMGAPMRRRTSVLALESQQLPA
jgi:hypothetical protein